MISSVRSDWEVRIWYRRERRVRNCSAAVRRQVGIDEDVHIGIQMPLRMRATFSQVIESQDSRRSQQPRFRLGEHARPCSPVPEKLAAPRRRSAALAFACGVSVNTLPSRLTRLLFGFF